ncbi:MAG: MBL fold metallo-hydrolase [Desulfarculus sp.]|nr:MBL fold metallo-hydrolase [Desulfarculus sp.]
MDPQKHPAIPLGRDLYQLGTRKFPVYLSLGEVGMLIEGGTSPTAGLIAAQVASLGIDPQRIRYIALTHTHADHIGAVPRLRQRWLHLQVVAGAKAAAHLNSPKGLEQFLPADRMIQKIFVGTGQMEALLPEMEDYGLRVDRVLAQGDSLDLGRGVVWTAHETPGHSACHMAYHAAGQGVAALGDMTGYFDPDLDLVWPNYFASLGDYVASLLSMAQLPAGMALLSHNGAMSGDMREFLARALRETLVYHHQVCQRLAEGEDQAQLCQHEARRIHAFAPIASPKAIDFLCQCLCRQSRQAAGLEEALELLGASAGLAGPGEAGATAWRAGPRLAAGGR